MKVVCTGSYHMINTIWESDEVKGILSIWFPWDENEKLMEVRMKNASHTALRKFAAHSPEIFDEDA